MLCGQMVKLGDKSDCLFGVSQRLLYKTSDGERRDQNLKILDLAG